MEERKKIAVIGAGAAGLMAALAAAEAGAAVTIYEKMGRPGRKIGITGKGRCNVTHVGDRERFLKNMVGNGKFLYSAWNALDNDALREMLRCAGVETKEERGGRVFPVSEKAADVVAAFEHTLRRLGVTFYLKTPVQELWQENERLCGVTLTDGRKEKADAVILATGGASYPGTGSTGDGYRMAEAVGHTLTPLQPALVPLEVEEEWVKELMGLSLRNVEASLWVDEKCETSEFGEMLFTHFGLSGPIILTLSRQAVMAVAAGSFVEIRVNLKPALSAEVLDKRLARDFVSLGRKRAVHCLDELLPSSLRPVVLDLAFINIAKEIGQLTREERHRLLELLQALPFTVTGARPLAEAIVTAGGVCVNEVDPRTMKSKKVEGLYLAGEVLDIDGNTGGFNLQAAFSTGYLAGRSAAQ
nr:NAD(P)/FAD-dependent oxidoreductase [uncultured Anaeromusa sp.]